MRVAIFGSWGGGREWPMRGQENQFRAACILVGAQLAQLGHTIIVQGAGESTADYHVVCGYRSVVKHGGRRGCVQVVQPHDHTAVYEEDARQDPELFEFYSLTEGSWGGAHLASIREADTIITIAGGKGTYIAGLAGIAAKKHVVPIAAFGGASEALLRALLSTLDGAEASEFRRLNAPWTDHMLVTVAHLARLEHKPRILIIHGRSNDFLDLKDWLISSGNVSKVLVMGHEFVPGISLPEKFEELASSVEAAVAVVTPDDRGGLQGSDVLMTRARQNVWLEIGWFWGRLGRNRILVLTTPEIEIPSDLQGVELFVYTSRPRDRAEELRKFLETVGIAARPNSR